MIKVKLIPRGLLPQSLTRQRVITKAIPEFLADPGLQEYIRLFGKLTTLSISFYCGLQYFHYRELRQQKSNEKKKKDDI